MLSSAPTPLFLIALDGPQYQSVQVLHRRPILLARFIVEHLRRVCISDNPLVLNFLIGSKSLINSSSFSFKCGGYQSTNSWS